MFAAFPAAEQYRLKAIPVVLTFRPAAFWILIDFMSANLRGRVGQRRRVESMQRNALRFVRAFTFDLTFSKEFIHTRHGGVELRRS
jgi:hypothetical protein